MASKSKGKRLLFEALSNSSEASKDKINVFEYQVNSESQELIPSKVTVYRNFFSLSPRLTIILVNITVLLILITIGYGISFGISTATPKQYGDFCNSTSDCSVNDHYVCSENKCKCPSGMFYKTTCVRQLGHSTPCTFENKDECGYGLYCLYDSYGSNKCLCPPERYWSTVTNYCETRIEFDQSGCTDSSQCRINSNLVCQSSKCTCAYPNYWNGTYCNVKGSYLQTCSIELGCDETKLLNCTVTGDYVYRCECDYTRFWSTVNSVCTSKFLEGISCNKSEECRTDLGLQCTAIAASSYQCKCDSNYYWDGTTCLIKKNNTEACSASIPCNDNQGLVCTSNTCSCPTNYFHNGIICEYFIKTGLNCAGPYGCDSNLLLSCDITLNQCVCPTTHFWNYITCVLKFLNGSSCIHDIQCDTVKLLTCDLTQNQCLCSFDKYWDSATPNCVAKKGIDQPCAQDYECQEYNGLICSTNCVCPADFYWDNTKCAPQLTYYAGCTNSGYEPCLISKGLTCNSSKCQCTDPLKYWNSAECVTKIAYGQNCIYQQYIDENYQCELLNRQLICLATPFVANSWSCQCKTTEYFDSNQCLDRKTYNQSCTLTSQCQDYFGLICYANSTCLCPSTQYWNGGRCVEKKAYGDACTVATNSANESCRDYAFIYCFSNVCGCESTRYYNTTFSACLPKSSHNQRCFSNNHCMASSPHSLTCLSNTCQCRNFNNGPSSGTQVYWSVASQNCLACPAGYSSGYGLGVYGSPYSITNRCYRIVRSNANSYTSAQNSCNNIVGANLITIRNIMELKMVKTQFSPGSANFVLSRTNTPLVFTWIFDGNKPVQNTFYCLDQPNDSGSNQDVLVLQNGICFNDLADTSSYSFICEIG